MTGGLRVLPAGWVRGTLITVTGLVTVVVALGDLASAWVVLALPLTVAVIVGYHEMLERLAQPRDPANPPRPAHVDPDSDAHPDPAGRSDPSL
ncbi:DUF2061 domain-containing protein [Frankia sp. AiPs1]|uniref:hypothetical protein n=1 Tax=Frankia sp. AiPa1 TaxID=573492 RepID=UPI00202B5FC0|nr:hypothetical protein [Frankia sp. AiPa1]MCL9761746.1 hypothetical protein [Frankia sp. AiPa1]